MLTEKNWPPLAVIRLLMWIFFSVSVGALVVSFALPRPAAPSPEQRVFSMIIGTVAFHGAALVCVGVFLQQQKLGWSAAFGFNRPGLNRAVAWGILGFVVILPVALLLGQLSAWLMTQASVPPVPQLAVRNLQETSSLPLKICFGTVAILLAPVAEEVFFRGILYPTLKERGYPRLALWGTAGFFALSHANVMTFIPLLVLALLLTRLYERTGNLLAPITTHALFNLANFLFLLFHLVPGL